MRERAFAAFEGAAADGALAATATMHTAVDAAVAAALATAPGSRGPACSHGCHWCCHVHVSVTAPEAIAAVRFARHQLSPADLASLEERLGRTAEGARGQSAADYPRQTCAFNVDGGCSVYPARPAHCRAAHSFDAGACEGAYARRPHADSPIPALRVVHEEARQVRLGYMEALVHGKVGRRIYELQQAAWLLLSDPTAADRWLAGDLDALDAARPAPSTG